MRSMRVNEKRQSATAQSRYSSITLDRSRRRSAFEQTTPRKYGGTGRVESKDGPKKEIWSSMLESVASGKRLPEKNVFILGGTPDSQKDFLNGLSQDFSNGKRPNERHSKRTPPVANQFALGYTYHDVLDADHEDILARLSLYLLSDPSPSFMHLLKPLLTSKTLSNTLIVILLDWAQPWDWLRQLRDWIRLLRSLLTSLDNDCQEAMEQIMKNERDRKRGGSYADAKTLAIIGEVSFPLGPGELDDLLGLPLCVVCQNADQTETLEKEHGWREEDFDFVQQTIRTVLLKYGSSMIYTTPSSSNSLQTLIHSSLDIQSLPQRQPVEHNVVDRDRILIPPFWDTWNKIRIMREGFDCEAVYKGWTTVDLEDSPPAPSDENQEANSDPQDQRTNQQQQVGAIALYEDTIRNPQASAPDDFLTTINHHAQKLEIEPVSTQTFLATQLEIMDRLKLEEEHQHQIRSTGINNNDTNSGVLASKITDQIGPIQFNMGGIQIDADDMLKRIRNRHGENNTNTTGTATSGISGVSTPDQKFNRDTVSTSSNAGKILAPGVTAGAGLAAGNIAGHPSSPERKSQNEALASFFAGLMKRGGGAGTPGQSGGGGGGGEGG